MSLLAILCKKQNDLKKQIKSKKVPEYEKEILRNNVSEIEVLLINRYKRKYND